MRCILFTVLLLTSWTSMAQSLIIDSIIFEGNKKTKNYILRRELDFRIHDTVDASTFPSRLESGRGRILNTGLFNEVTANIKSWNTETNHIKVHIKVEESWYIIPVPIFELADRNFNVWWNDFHGSLDRINYGIRFVHQNLTGQQDALKITAHTGYSQKLDLSYDWPFWGKNAAWRFSTDFLFSKARETYYNTLENKLSFYKSSDDYPLERIKIGTSLENRTTLQLFQSIRLEYHQNKISDSIVQLNPSYFLHGKNRQNYLELIYTFKYDDRDLKYFPTRGRFAEITIDKEGIGNTTGLNTLTAKFALDQIIPWNERHNAGVQLRAKTSIIRNQIPYFNSRALGFSDNYLKGYEYYVIDGLDYFYLKFRERYIFLKNHFHYKLPFSKNKKEVPIQLAISANAGTGYVNNVFYSESNNYSNRWLYNTGISIESLLYNTVMFQLDYSVNHAGKSGFYLHFHENF